MRGGVLRVPPTCSHPHRAQPVPLTANAPSEGGKPCPPLGGSFCVVPQFVPTVRRVLWDPPPSPAELNPMLPYSLYPL